MAPEPELPGGSSRDPATPGDTAHPSGTAAFDYALPPALIAHHPAAERDASRLLVVRRDSAEFDHLRFRDIVRLIPPGDVLVLNETRVIPARLLGRREGGGAAEIVLLHPAAEAGAEGDGGMAGAGADWPDAWAALVKPGARLRPGRVVRIGPDFDVEVVAALPDGARVVRLRTPLPIREAVERYGRIPLPPYIDREPEVADRERYQTVYARTEGSVAAPTAGLHFTPAVLAALRERGVEIVTVLLHVGAGTFRPVETADPADHIMHPEWYEVGSRQAERMNAVRAAGGRVWAVGTTVARTLETVVDRDGTTPTIRPGSGWTRLFIRPGFRFLAVDRLVTNFHLPRSTLLMLVSAFAGHDRAMRAYREAIAERYRFYSYGDAMVVI
ncbi:MAG TPA: tRNA preQ1(34) S-adenosylmethionine ribosyltransferase-isomerase QueA [Longimicrobiales bacterium]|nr:tRNA preQ1(34) S-adenosylmethionine ribosyltransferase-isomerase QueA [Longimicrobiales bacterium]